MIEKVSNIIYQEVSEIGESGPASVFDPVRYFAISVSGGNSLLKCICVSDASSGASCANCSNVSAALLFASIEWEMFENGHDIHLQEWKETIILLKRGIWVLKSIRGARQ
jgi:hypothetical protein